MSETDGEETAIFELTDSGKAARVQQILERMEIADQALSQRDEYGNKQVYQAVKSYVQQFEGIAHTHGFTDYLFNREMGEIQMKDVQPIIASIADDPNASVANPGRFPITIHGASGFIGANTVTIVWEGSGGELTSARETSKVDLYVPSETSETAFRETLKFQSNIGLEIDPGEIAVAENDPI